MSHDFPQFITGGQGLFTTQQSLIHLLPPVDPIFPKKPSDLPIFAIVLTMDLLEIGAGLQSFTFVLQLVLDRATPNSNTQNSNCTKLELDDLNFQGTLT